MEQLALLDEGIAQIRLQVEMFQVWAAQSIDVLAYALGVKVPTSPIGRTDAERIYLEHNGAEDIAAQESEPRPFGATGIEVERGWAEAQRRRPS